MRNILFHLIRIPADHPTVLPRRKQISRILVCLWTFVVGGVLLPVSHSLFTVLPAETHDVENHGEGPRQITLSVPCDDSTHAHECVLEKIVISARSVFGATAKALPADFWPLAIVHEDEPALPQFSSVRGRAPPTA